MAAEMTFKKTVSADDAGFQYERKMTTLIALRLYNTMDEFYLASNLDKAGKFDDIAFRTRLNDDWNTCFLQLKHKQAQSLMNKKITLAALQRGVNGNKDFVLEHYLKSFIDVYCKFMSGKDDIFFKPENYATTTFFIFTNANFNHEILERMQEQVDVNFLSTNPEGEFNVRFDPNEDSDLFPNFWDSDWCKLFTKQLIFCSGQASEHELDKLIEEEVKKTSDLTPVEIKYVIGQLKEYFNNWYNGGRYMTKGDVQKILSRSSTETKAGKRDEVNVKYLTSFLEYFTNSLQPGPPHVIICEADSIVLCMAALKQIGLLTEPNKLMSLRNLERSEIKDHLLNGSDDGALVVDCETDHLGIDLGKFVEFIEKLNKVKGRSLIILVLTHVNSKVLAALTGLPSSRRKFNCTLENLNDESRNYLMECKLSFQSFKTPLGSLIGNTRSLDVVFDMAAMTTLLLGRDLNVGIKPVEQISYYVTRVLTRRNISFNVFTASQEYIKIVLFGTTVERAKAGLNLSADLVISSRDVLNNACLVQNKKVIVIEGGPPYAIFEKLSNIIYNNLHLLFLTPKGKLCWRASTNGVHNLFRFLEHHGMEYVPTDNIMAIQDKMVVVSAEPGMGKSTLLVHLAAETKRLCPHIWVISLCLSDYTDYFSNPKFMVNIEGNVKNLVALAAGTSAETSKFDATLFNYCYDVTGNMIILLDGFDEITPFYTKQGLAVLRVLQQTKVARVWVTTRSFMRNALQTELQALSYSIRPFGDSDQKRFFTKYWKDQIPEIRDDTLNEFIEQLRNLIKTSFDEAWSVFTGIPLQTRMIAEVFTEELRNFHETGSLRLPNTLNGLQLFQTFVQRKLDIMIGEKLKIAGSNVGKQMLQKSILEPHEQLLMHLALLTILPPEKCTEISPPITASDVAKLKEKIEAEGDITGIVVSFRAETPHFIHRTFAEYFVAKFFASRLTENKSFLSSEYFSSDAFTFVRYLFDRLLAGDSNLHLAVLNRDLDGLNDILQSKPNVNDKDDGGRTPLHLAASLPNMGEIIGVLLENGADKSVRDSSSSWIPLEYAIKIDCLENIAPLVDGPDCYFLIKDAIPISCDSLKLAVVGDYLQVMLYLLEKGITSVIGIDVLPQHPWKEDIPCDGFTLLHLAAMFNAQSILKYFLRNDTRDSKLWLLERKDAKGKTPLMLAASHGSFEVAKLLLKAGAQLPERKSFEDDLARLAVESQDDEFFNVILTSAKERNMSSDWFSGALMPLFSDKSRWSAVAFLHLIESFPELVHCKTNKGIPILVAAAMKTNEACVRILCSKGVDVNSSNNGRTALHFAVLGNDPNLVEFLLTQPNIDIEACGEEGITPLYIAVEKGDWPVFQLLINRGANINVKCLNGETLSHAVTEACNQEIFDYLISKGVSFKTPNIDGVTALDNLEAAEMAEMVEEIKNTFQLPEFHAFPTPPPINTSTAIREPHQQNLSDVDVLLNQLKENPSLLQQEDIVQKLATFLTKTNVTQQGERKKWNKNNKSTKFNKQPTVKVQKNINLSVSVVPSPHALISPPILPLMVTEPIFDKSNFNPITSIKPTKPFFSSYKRNFQTQKEKRPFPPRIKLPDLSTPPPNLTKGSKTSLPKKPHVPPNKQAKKGPKPNTGNAFSNQPHHSGPPPHGNQGPHSGGFQNKGPQGHQAHPPHGNQGPHQGGFQNKGHQAHPNAHPPQGNKGPHPGGFQNKGPQSHQAHPPHGNQGPHPGGFPNKGHQDHPNAHPSHGNKGPHPGGFQNKGPHGHQAHPNAHPSQGNKGPTGQHGQNKGSTNPHQAHSHGPKPHGNKGPSAGSKGPPKPQNRPKK